ncbi:MAG TPA: hypothetical protein VF789_12065 [Thermoanaerobaculia bacterium]
MAGSIVILTETEDIHAYAVSEALSLKGRPPVLWHTSDFPSASVETFHFQGRQLEAVIEGSDFTIVPEDVSVVWRRRPSHVIPESILHPADQAFAETECSVFRRSALSVLADGAFWVNSPDAANRASRKILQHKLALEVGLSVPDTIYTNDPQKIRGFIRSHHGTAVYKPFRGVAWRTPDRSWVPFTSEVSEATLVEADLLQLVPGIYQELLPKSYEIRVTVMGRQVFAAKILSQETASGKLDWRKSYGELRMEPIELPAEVSSRCLKLMARLDLVFGCFDFVVTPAKEYYFLEVNEMGQFLFVERFTDLPLLDAFSDFLISGRPDFVWEPSAHPISYSEVEARAHSFAEEMSRCHISSPEAVSRE